MLYHHKSCRTAEKEGRKNKSDRLRHDNKGIALDWFHTWYPVTWTRKKRPLHQVAYSDDAPTSMAENDNAASDDQFGQLVSSISLAHLQLLMPEGV